MHTSEVKRRKPDARRMKNHDAGNEGCGAACFSDRRSGAVRQQKMAEMVQHRPQARASGLLRTLTGMSAVRFSGHPTPADQCCPPVIQRALAADKLNVVGENHDESDKRRPQEINFSKSKIDQEAGYWEESGFSLGDQTGWGDPKHLRIIDLLARIERHFTPLKAMAKKGAAGTAFSLDQRRFLKNMLTKAMSLHFRLLKGEIIEIIRLTKVGKTPLFGHMAKEEFVPWARTGLRLKAKLQARINEIEGYMDDDTGIEDYFLELSGTCSEITDYGSQSIGNDAQLKQNTTTRRSGAMHQAANQAAATLGVWKVGQKHVEDIKQMPQDEGRDYELTDQKDFNNDLAQASPQPADTPGLEEGN